MTLSENREENPFVDFKKRLRKYVEGCLDNLPTKPYPKLPMIELTEVILIDHDQISSVEFFKFLSPYSSMGMFLNHHLQVATKEKPETTRETTVLDFSHNSLSPNENVITTIVEGLKPSVVTYQKETGGSYEFALSVLFSLHKGYPEQFPDPSIIWAPQ